MVTKVTEKNREKRIREKIGILVESLAREIIKDSKDGDTDPKKVESFTKMLDRYKGATPGRLPSTKLDQDVVVVENSPIDIPDLPT